MGKTGLSSYRLWAAIILVAVLALVPNLKLLWKGIEAYRGSDGVDDITMFEERFAMLKEALPPEGVFGYMTDDSSSGDIEYFLTQYSLAPRVITRDKNLPYVVGNFHSASALEDPRQFMPLFIVMDSGNGILLFRNASSR